MLHHTRSLMLIASALSTTLVAIDASAANSSSLGSVAIKPAFHSAGIRVPISGDDNGNAQIAVSYAVAGSAQARQGHRLLRLSGARGAGSLFSLAPDTEYDVTLTLTDPDNSGPLTSTATFRTRADLPAVGKGGALYIHAVTGNDSNTGSKDSPFKTIQRAADAASAGTTVHVGAGVYREAVSVKTGHGGAEDNPVWFLAEPGAVVDGSDPALEDGKAFQSDGGGLWSAPFQGECRYVAVDDARLYDYPTLSALQSGTSGIAGGFFVDKAAGRIRLKMPAGDSPALHKIHVARFPAAFTLDTVTDVVLDGFEVRYFGTIQYSGVAVDVRNTSRAWIRKNDIHHVNEGVRLRQGGADNVVELNSIRDTGSWTWPWDAVKNHTPEASAITASGGGGCVIRRNTTRGNFNGIYIGSFDDSSEAIAPDTDVYGNTMSEHGDDAFEPEGACVNVRIWDNAVRGMHNGLSLAPIEVGPLWAVRNLLADYKAHALKVNNGPTGWMLVYHNTSAPAAVDSEAMAPTVAFSRLVTRNNIWAAHRYVLESTVGAGASDLDYDNLYTDSQDGTPRFVKWANVRYDDIAELKASNTIEKHGWAVAPKYEDASGGDYTLVEGSPLIDVGVVIPGINDEGFTGKGPDVGAFERGGVAPGTGGAAGTGGGQGGSPGTGGAAGTGGEAGIGGAPGGGGTAGHGGVAGSGAADAGPAIGTGGTAGAPGTGGAAGAVGQDAGAASGTGGKPGTGGAAGASGQGGSPDAGVGTTDGGAAVIDDDPPEGGGCATSPVRSGGGWSLLALAPLALLRNRRKRSDRLG